MSDALDSAATARPANPSTQRVRRYRERRREGLQLFTVTVPETVIEGAIARGLRRTPLKKVSHGQGQPIHDGGRVVLIISLPRELRAAW
jgi:hypothetical protein